MMCSINAIISRIRLPAWYAVSLVLVVLCALAVRFFRLGAVPIELTRDEASLGYTAYSLLKTGKDEHGQPWPISIESFGDWKLPGYVYTLIPVVQLFGLTEWSVRLPSAVAGIAVMLGAMVLVHQLSTSSSTQVRRWLVLLTGIFVAFSPWSIHVSHVAYEANLSLALLVWGMVTLLASRNQVAWLVPAGFLLGLSLLTYHSMQVVAPVLGLYVLWDGWSRWQLLIRRHWQYVVVAAVLCLAPVILFLSSGGLGANQTKLSGLTIFDRSLYRQRALEQSAFFYELPSVVQSFYTAPLVQLGDQVQRNLAAAISTRFLLFEGGGHGSHDIPGTGKLVFVHWVLAWIGVGRFVYQRWLSPKSGADMPGFWLVWLVIGFVPALITFQPAHTIRSIASTVPLAVLAAYGAVGVWQALASHPRRRLVLAGVIVGFFFASTAHFLITYYYVSPVRDATNWHWQVDALTELLAAQGHEYERILVQGSSWSPYIYYAFKTQYDPAALQSQIEYYPADSGGFRHVRSLGKIEFVPNINWNEVETSEKSTLIAVRRAAVPIDKLESPRFHVMAELTHPFANSKWLLIAFQIL